MYEPELCKHHASLDEQCLQQEIRERRLVVDSAKDVPSPTDDSPPALIPDDEDSNDDESADGDPSPPCDSESEEENSDDFWHSDHPSLEHELENERF